MILKCFLLANNLSSSETQGRLDDGERFQKPAIEPLGNYLLTNHFHDLFECLPESFCAQSEARVYRAAFVIFLYERVYMQIGLHMAISQTCCVPQGSILGLLLFLI